MVTLSQALRWALGTIFKLFGQHWDNNSSEGLPIPISRLLGKLPLVSNRSYGISPRQSSSCEPNPATPKSVVVANPLLQESSVP